MTEPCNFCGHDPTQAPPRRFYPNGFWINAGLGQYEWKGKLSTLYVKVSQLNAKYPHRKYRGTKTIVGFFITRTK